MNTVIDQSKTHHMDGPKVIHIMAMENNEKEGLGFKCKVEDLQAPLHAIRTIKKETNDHQGKLTFNLYKIKIFY